MFNSAPAFRTAQATGLLILLTIIAIARYHIAGPFLLDLSINTTVKDLINPLAIMLTTLLLLGAFHLPFIKNPPCRRGLRIYRLVAWPLFGLLFIYALIVVRFVVDGPFVIDIPLIANLTQPGRAYLWLIILTLLMTAIFCYETDRGEVQQSSSGKLFSWSIVAIVVLCLFLRLWGLYQGIDDDTHHPDATKQVFAVQAYLKGEYTFDMDRYGAGQNHQNETFGYPFFAMHFVEGILQLRQSLADFADTQLESMTSNHIVMAARWLNVLYETIIVILIWRIGLLLGLGSVTALWASFLLAVSMIHTQMSHYLGADLPMSFFAAIALYFAARCIKHEKSLWYALFGITTALSAACKYNGVLVFLFAALLFLRLHPSPTAVFARLRRPILALALFGLTFILTSANLMSDPAKAGAGLLNTMAYSGYYGIADPTFGGKIDFLVNNVPYHTWVFFGLFAPIPWWIVIPLFGLGVWRLGRDTWYVWAAPLLIFFAGKLSMPASGVSHFLHITPLLALTIGAGIDGIRLLLCRGSLRHTLPVMAALLALFSLYRSAQDNSFWLLQPLYRENMVWANDNLTPWALQTGAVTIADRLEPIPPKKTGDRQIVHLRHGATGQALSLHRDYHVQYLLDSGKPARFWPPTQFIKGGWKKERYRRDGLMIYADGHDLAVTTRAFLTGTSSSGQTATRYIVPPVDANNWRVAVWVKNFTEKENRVTVRVGGKRFSYTLKAFETAPLSIAATPGRTFFFDGALVEIMAESQKTAGWIVARSESEISDLARSAKGDKPETTIAPGMWSKIAGYPDKIFADKMRRKVPYRLGWSKKATRTILRYFDDDEAQRKNLPSEKTVWHIGEGGEMYGPYLPLLAGMYTVTARVGRSSALKYIFDVVSDSGRTTVYREQVMVNNTTADCSDAPVTTFDFDIEAPMAYPVEFRFHDILGGDLKLCDVQLSIDYNRALTGLITDH